MTREHRQCIRQARDAATRARVYADHCPRCHTPLQPHHRPNQRFCSPHCRKMHWEENRVAA